MFHLLGLVLLVGLVDSANPSTIAPALYLAAGKTAVRGLLGFVAGVLVVNLAGGLALTLGPGQALRALVPHPGATVKHAIEVGLGGALLVLAAGLWLGRRRVEHRVLGNQNRIDRSSFLVGAGIAAIELPTAVPYFAVIAAIVESGRSVVTETGLLVAFNLIFVAPLVVILGVRSLARERGRPGARAAAASTRAAAGVIVPPPACC